MQSAAAASTAGSIKPYKRPVSVLVVIHTPALDVLLIERADKPGFWQSVTGSQVFCLCVCQADKQRVRKHDNA
jgi:dATP pyrophosphohydrolase